jgi:hypothetical protein
MKLKLGDMVRHTICDHKSCPYINKVGIIKNIIGDVCYVTLNEIPSVDSIFELNSLILVIRKDI